MSRYLGPFEHLLLLALTHLGDEAYTVSVRAFLEHATGRSVSPGAIYTALTRLEARGFVASRFGDPTPERGGKRKKYFTLEPAGAAAVREAQEQLSRIGKAAAPRLRSLS
jgi:DNA-binding PadR family transcriptional regulator